MTDDGVIPPGQGDSKTCHYEQRNSIYERDVIKMEKAIIKDSFKPKKRKNSNELKCVVIELEWSQTDRRAR